MIGKQRRLTIFILGKNDAVTPCHFLGPKVSIFQFSLKPLCEQTGIKIIQRAIWSFHDEEEIKITHFHFWQKRRTIFAKKWQFFSPIFFLPERPFWKQKGINTILRAIWKFNDEKTEMG